MADLTEDLAGLTDAIVRPLIDEPDALDITAAETEDGNIMVEIRVAADDAGKVIGRQGRVIKSIRHLGPRRRVEVGQAGRCGAHRLNARLDVHRLSGETEEFEREGSSHAVRRAFPLCCTPGLTLAVVPPQLDAPRTLTASEVTERAENEALVFFDEVSDLSSAEFLPAASFWPARGDIDASVLEEAEALPAWEGWSARRARGIRGRGRGSCRARDPAFAHGAPPRGERRSSRWWTSSSLASTRAAAASMCPCPPACSICRTPRASSSFRPSAPPIDRGSYAHRNPLHVPAYSTTRSWASP